MKYFILSFFVLTPLLISAQPWTKSVFDKTRKEFKDISVREHVEAFDAWWLNRKVEKGKGFMAFSRWKDFADIRTVETSNLPSDIFFNEWLKYKQMKSVAGNWSYAGADETPLTINDQTRSGSGRVNAIGFHPSNPNIIYVGAPAGGLWKSANGGATWACKTNNLPSIGISDIVFHPDNPNTIYIATGDADAMDSYSCGLMKSMDGGETWETTGYKPNVNVNQIINKVLINTQSPDTILLATNNGIRLSSNGGTSFTQVKAGRFRDMKFNPADPSIVYASSSSYTDGAKIYKSVNGGKTWIEFSPDSAEMTAVFRITLAVTPANSDVIYALASRMDDDGFYALYCSSDMGVTWEKRISYENINLLGWEYDGSDSGGQGWYDLGLAVSLDDENDVVVGGVNLWSSSDGGFSFGLIGHWIGMGANYVHADQHILKFQPGTNAFFAGCDGGFYKTINNGDNWTDLSDGLQIMQIYRIGVSSHGADILVSGTQDNGTMLKLDVAWNNILGGDGMDCMVDYNDPGLLYGEYYYGSLFRSYISGYSWESIRPAEAQDGSWITPLAMHPQTSSTIYAGYEDVYKSDNNGDSWYRISDSLLNGAKLTILEISKSDPNMLIAGDRDNIYKTTNGGSTWTSITNSLFAGQITSVCISTDDKNKIWVSVSGYTYTKKVFFSEDGGVSWSNLSSGLPNVPANCLVYEPGSPDRIYVGTDFGVYVIDTLLTEWIPFSSGLPNTVVNDLVVSSGKLIAATYGRGLWISDLLTQYPQGIAVKENVLDCRVFPNPANEQIQINIPSGVGQTYTTTIYTTDGRLVQNSEFNGIETTLDLRSIQPGIYFLKISGSQGVTVKTINISR